jgi:homospermidine synthase
MSAAQVRERHNPGHTPAARRFLVVNPELRTLFLVFGPVEGHVTDRTPLSARAPLFPHGVDECDPGQVRNVLAC